VTGRDTGRRSDGPDSDIALAIKPDVEPDTEPDTEPDLGRV
jgi:hypothetical protein